MRKVGGVSAKKPPVSGPLAAAHADFVFNGGPVIDYPLIYASFWGSHWSDATHQAQSTRLIQFLKDLIQSTWMNIMTQYGAGSGRGGGEFVGTSFVSSVTANLTDAGIHTVLQSAINSGSIPEPPANNSSQVIVIYLDESVAVNDPTFGVVMCEASGDNAFGYHNFFVTSAGNNCYYAVIPVLDDNCINSTCPGGCSLTLSETQEQRRTQVTSHEFAEMITDPKFPTGWFGNTSDENGDICNGETTTITVGSNTWNVQRIYSKTDDINTNGASFCLANAPNPIPRLAGGPGNAVQSSSDFPSLAVFNNRLWVSFIANNGGKALLVCSSADGQNWSDNSIVQGQSSNLATSLAALGGSFRVAFIANNSSNDVLVCSSTDGTHWSGNTQVQGQSSKTAPSLAVFGGKLWVAFIANNSSNDVLVCSSTDGTHWSGNTQVQGQSSKAAPSLAAFGSKLWVAFIANNSGNDVLLCSSPDGQTWSNNIIV